MTRTAVDAAGSILSHYFLTHLSNATVTGGVVEGASTEGQVNGTLSGTLNNLMGLESPATTTSTGGTVARASGVLGYVFNTVGSTTAITNAYGLWGRGCQGSISGTAPTNCYGVFADRQLGAGLTRNYAIGINGQGLVLFDQNLGKGGLDFEDITNVPRQTLYVANDNTLNLQAVNATGGLNLSDSTGATRAKVTSSGFQIQTGLAQGTGVKHQQFGATCTTGAAQGAACTTTYTWTAAFADANYRVVCSLTGAVVGAPAIQGTSSLLGASFVLTILSVNAAASSAPNVDCIGIHQ